MSPETIFNLHLILGYVAWLLCFRAYLLPRLKSMDLVEAHRAIATVQLHLRPRGAVPKAVDRLAMSRRHHRKSGLVYARRTLPVWLDPWSIVVLMVSASLSETALF